MRQAIVISSVLILVLLSAGCITSPWQENSAIQWGDDTNSAEANYPGSFFPSSGASRSSGPQPGPTAAPSSSGESPDEMIITTASITMEVRNVTLALDPLKAIARNHGGYISSLSMNAKSGGHQSAAVTMRIPAHSFDSAAGEIKALGSVKSESVTADDVTEEYVDLQARKSALAGQLAQYRRIIERAENVSEILEVQVQIERVQVEIDRIEGRLRYLDNRVAYATITVLIQEPQIVGGTGTFSIVSVINEGITGFLTVTAGLIIIIISLIPLIALVCASYLIIRWWKRRTH